MLNLTPFLRRFQLIAQGNQLIDLGNDALLLGNGRDGDRKAGETLPCKVSKRCASGMRDQAPRLSARTQKQYDVSRIHPFKQANSMKCLLEVHVRLSPIPHRRPPRLPTLAYEDVASAENEFGQLAIFKRHHIDV